MAFETPNPTAIEILGLAPTLGASVDLAQDEIVRRLRQNLPGVIAAYNAASGLTGNNAVQDAKAYGIAPASLAAGDWANQILVGVTVSTTAQGIGAFQDEVAVDVYSIDARIESGRQIRAHWQRALLIRLCLLPFLTGCVNAAGQVCWQLLEPTGYAMLPLDWEEYSGTVCNYRLIQAPGGI